MNRHLIRNWLLAGACATVAVSGCASMSEKPAFSWFKKSAPTQPKFAQAKKDLKDPGKLHLAYAKMQEHAGNSIEARQSYEFALSEDPKSVEALIGLARLDQLAGRNQEAERGFLKALQTVPNDPRALHALGQFYASEDRWDEAAKALKAASDAAPDDTTCRYSLAVALAQKGDLQQAIPLFVRTVGEAEAHYNVGYILFENGNVVGAEQHLQLAAQKNPQLTQAKMMLAHIHRGRGGDVQLANGTRPNGPDSGNVHASMNSASSFMPNQPEIQPGMRRNNTTSDSDWFTPNTPSNVQQPNAGF